MVIKDWLKILKRSGAKFLTDNCFQDSAAIAFYTIFSLPGIALISITIASSFFYDDAEVQSELLKQISLLMGQNSAEQVDQLINSDFFAFDTVIMKTFGTIILLVSTTTVFISLQESLNKIWKVKARPKRFLLRLLVNRLLSLAMVASVGFLLLVSLTMDTLMAMLRYLVADYLPVISIYLIMVINFIFTVAITWLVFASIYKVLPDVSTKWKDVWRGSLFTTMLFTAGKYLIAYYLSNTNLTDAYGAAGSLVALLAWVYYSIMILLFGAQFTYVYSDMKGRKIKTSRGSVAFKVVELPKESATEDSAK